MRNFIVVAVFVAILAFGTTGYSEKLEEVAEKTAEISKAQAQAEKLSTTISEGLANIEKATVVIDECLEFSEEVTKMQNAEIDKMLREMEEGREEYQQAIEKYFSSSN